jgi:phosphatidylinositol alpha 1,6-mannosyltransferase
MEENLRVAFFPDTYDEIDGLATTSRQFEAFARKRGISFLIVCGGAQNQIQTGGSVIRMTRRRGRIGFSLNKNHRFDLAFWRHYHRVAETVRKFDPDILHIAAPGDVGQLGALIAHRLRIPLTASWHTNLHHCAEQRASPLLRFAPRHWRERTGSAIRESCLAALVRFYKIPQAIFVPNPELRDVLEKRTGKPVYLMRRGVDTDLFRPQRRDRRGGAFIIGYVGRLTAEKNVRFLAELERALRESGFSNFGFSIVGQGSEQRWLAANMQKADFSGVLTGEDLARAYANMDVFVFPSRADSFGNVVLEALASGVPAIVTESGGPKFIVKPGETGFVAGNPKEFVSHIRYLAERHQHLQMMRDASRAYALKAPWDAVFEGLYADYERELRDCAAMGKHVRVRSQSASSAPRVSSPEASLGDAHEGILENMSRLD